jgi:hypothetical protein
MRKLREACNRGHVYNETDSYIDNRGYRKCRQCRRDQDLRARANSVYRNPTKPEELAEIVDGRDIRTEREVLEVEMIIYRFLDLIDRATERQSRQKRKEAA